MKIQLDLPRIPIEFFRLKNGLRVLVSEDHSVPIVSIAVSYDVGSRSEKPGRSGFAHLFEHMMFQGSANVAKQEHFRHIESRGGDANGFTMKDFTCYYETLPAKELALGLWLEADRMKSLAITQENFDNQKDVVQEEKRMRYENQPYMSAIGEVYPKLVYSNWSNQHSVIGSFEDLDRATVEDLREFFQSYYPPSNAVLCVVGDAKAAEVRRLAEKYFGSIPKGRTPARPDLTEPALSGIQRETVEDSFAQQPLLLAGWQAPERNSGHYRALAVAGALLTRGEDSRLYRKLVKEKEWALDVSGGLGSPFGSFFTFKDPSVFSLMVRYKPKVNDGQILEVLHQEIEALAQGRLEREELECARRKFKADLLDDLASSETRAYWMGIYALLNPDKPKGFLNEIRRYMDGITVDDIAQAARACLAPDRVHVLLIQPSSKPPSAPEIAAPRPKPEGAAQIQNGAKAKKEKPPLAPSSALKSLTIKTRVLKLKNGISVTLVEDKRLPFLKFRLLAPNPAGTGFNGSGPADRPAISKALALREAAAELFKSGTSSKDNAAIEKELAGLGASLGVSSGTDYSVVSGGTLSETIPEFFSLLTELLTDPVFPEKELALWKENTLEEIRHNKTLPEHLMRERLALELFGTHPYGIVDPDPESVNAVERRTLLQFHEERKAPSLWKLTVVGDVSEKKLKAVLEATLGKVRRLSPEAPVLRKKSVFKPNDSGRIVIVDRPGAAQSNIALGYLTLERGHPEFYAFSAANSVLGSMFNSRLLTRLREEKGYTYSIRSSLDFKRDAGVFTIATSVRTPVTVEALKEILAVVERTRQEGISSAEAEEVLNFLIGLDLIRLSDQESLAGRIASLEVLGLPLSEMAHYSKRISRLKEKEINRAALRHLTPGKFCVVVVGDAAKISQGLASLGKVKSVPAFSK